MIMPSSKNRSNYAFRYGLQRLATISTAKSGFKKLTKMHAIILCGTALITILTVVTLHPFLAVNKPVEGHILIVEGWLPEYVLKQSIDEFNRGKYRYLVTTGGPVSSASRASGCSSYAECAANTLKDLGVKESLLIPVPAPYVKRHRTFTAALAIKDWLKKSDLNPNVTAVNIFTIGAHARKSYVLFKTALKPGIRVGIISAKPNTYDPKYWFLSTEGFHWVFRDSIGYLYALLLSFLN